MKIPVFHDDQHGTAIIVGAAVLNGLRVVGKKFAEAKLVCSGAGAAATRLPRHAGEPRAASARTCGVADIKGVVLAGAHRADGRQQGPLRAADVGAKRSPRSFAGADIFLGLSAGGVLKPEMGEDDGRATAHPGPGQPGARDHARGAKAARPDAIVAHRPLGLFRTRSTTCFASRSSSAARSTAGRPTINEADEARRSASPSPSSRRAEQSDIVATAYSHETRSARTTSSRARSIRG
jgi:malate dehydrogenase (oxaloacetate-decarboxylating)(NADP+)